MSPAARPLLSLLPLPITCNRSRERAALGRGNVCPCPSQAGMLAPGTRRDIYDQKLTLQPVDSSTISLQMGTNKVASQKGMSVYGLGRQVYDPKYCAAPTEPVIRNGSQGTGTNGSEVSDSDSQAEYPDEYHGGYPDDDPREYQYGDPGLGLDY